MSILFKYDINNKIMKNNKNWIKINNDITYVVPIISYNSAEIKKLDILKDNIKTVIYR